MTVVLETMDVIEWDSDKWIIDTDGTNQNDWAERIDGADKTYRTPGGITGESCCNCNYRQSWIFLPFVYIFPVCAAWLGEMTTLGPILRSWTIDGINGIKWADGVYRVVFLTGPPDFQYQNEKTCSAKEELFNIENFVKN